MTISLHERNQYDAWAENISADPDDLDEDGFRKAFYGTYVSEEDFATQLFDDLYAHEIPEHLGTYIDYKQFSRDLFRGDYYSIKDPEGPNIWVFRNI